MGHLSKSPGCWPAAGLGARWVIPDRPGGSILAVVGWDVMGHDGT